jgi:hypothetical protein
MSPRKQAFQPGSFRPTPRASQAQTRWSPGTHPVSAAAAADRAMANPRAQTAARLSIEGQDITGFPGSDLWCGIASDPGHIHI